MATMYPQRLPNSVKSNAERKLFDVLRDYLPNEYIVLWSIDWTEPRSPGVKSSVQESDIDFLVLHPDKGILVLEVKGGGVGYDGALHEWYTVDRNNTRHKIKDPFEQAKDGKHALIRELTQKVPLFWLKDACRKSVFGHAVVFPDIPKSRVANRPTRPEEVILDHQDVQTGTIRRAIDDAYAFWRRDTSQSLGRAAVDEIIQMYAPSWYIRPLLATVFEEEKAQLKELTERQFDILDHLRKQRRVAISGCAGSGKTLLAIEQAKRLARRGFSVLVTCYNRNLAHWLSRRLSEQAETDLALRSIDVYSFHQLASRLCQQAHVPIQTTDESRKYDEAFADALLEAAGHITQRYDAIIADEGQDFNDTWWVALLSLLRSQEDSYFYVFYDDNQRIYGRQSSYPVSDDHHYLLNSNCRTTVKIHDEVMHYYNSAELPECKGPPGRDIERVSIVQTGANEYKTLARVLQRLTKDEKIPLDEIVLLSPVGKERSRFHEGSTIGGQFRISWDMNGVPMPNILTCCTIFSFKGLECDIVILAEPDKIQDTAEREQLIYVALSRARMHLIILGNLQSL